MPDEQFDDLVRRQIWDAFGIDDMTPDERAFWDAYNRAMDAFQRSEDEAAARVIRNAKAVAAWINENPSVLDELMPGAGAVMAEHGLRFAWEKA